jgi:hypothetical protein
MNIIFIYTKFCYNDMSKVCKSVTSVFQNTLVMMYEHDVRRKFIKLNLHQHVSMRRFM